MSRTVRLTATLCAAVLAAVALSAWHRPVPPKPPAPAAVAQPHMIGTFFQPGTGGGTNWTWTPARYATEQTQLNAVKMSDVIVQWSVDGQTALYPTANTWYTVKQDMIGAVLNANAATGNKGKIWVGLATPVYWDWYVNSGNPTWIQNLLTQQRAVASELAAKYPGRIAGFFAPQETDDAVLADSVKSAGARTYYKALAAHAHSLGLKLMTAPFYSGLRLNPAQFAAALKSTFGTTGIDVLTVQDGLGATNISQALGVQYFAAMKSALAGTGVALAVDHDMYDMRRGGGAMLPADLQSHIKALAPYVTAAYGFSFPSQMGPDDIGTATYYNAYKTYVGN